MTLVGPDNRESSPASPKQPPGWLRQLLDSPKSPYVLAVLLIFNTYAALKSEIEYWWLQPRREAAKEREEARREGRASKPRVEVYFNKRDCTALNADGRDVLNAKMYVAWHMIGTAVSSVLDEPDREPVRSAPVLQPGERLTYEVPGAIPAKACDEARKYMKAGDPEAVSAFVECGVTFYRQADREKFTQSRYFIVDPETCSYEPLVSYFYDQPTGNGSFQTVWKDTSAERAFARLLRRQKWGSEQLPQLRARGQQVENPK